MYDGSLALHFPLYQMIDIVTTRHDDDDYSKTIRARQLCRGIVFHWRLFVCQSVCPFVF